MEAADNSASEASALSVAESRRLVEDLRCFEAELRAQNEELRATQAQIETSRQEYVRLFEGSPIPMIVTDRRDWIVRANQRARELLGFRSQDPVGAPISAYTDRGESGRLFSHFRRCQRSSRRSEDEFRIRGGGARRLARFVTDPFHGGHLLTAIVDLTDIRNVEAAQRRSEKRYRSLFAENRDALFLIEADTAAILEANRAAQSILHAESEDKLIGRSLEEFVPAEQRGAWRYVTGSAREGRGQVVELTFSSGAEDVLAEVRISQVDAEQPTLLVNLRDVRDRQKLMEERSKLEQKLSQVEKMEALGTLAGGVAHDMNNMLTAVQVAASCLVEDLPEGSTQRDEAEAIMTACTRFTSLVENLLGFARQEPDRPRSARVGDVVKEVVNLVESRVRRSEVSLTTDLEVPNLHVAADAARLSQSVMNLVLNALDELPPSANSRVSVGAFAVQRSEVNVPEDVEGDDFICIHVDDNGPGMNPQVKARAFDPFFTTKQEGKGTGLGLAVVYRNVRRFGGWVAIDSEVGRGTSVMLYLPRVVARVRPVSVAPTLEPAVQPLILVVEDEELVAKSVGRYLRRSGFNVHVANNGREGVQVFDVVKPDAVLLDVVMPEMDGPTCAKHLRQIQKDIPILFYSAHLRNHGLADLGLDERTDFLEKPFDFNNLRSRLVKLMGLSTIPSRRRESPAMQIAEPCSVES